MSDDLDKEMNAWLQSQQVNGTADYVRRGRQFGNLALADLTAQWADDLVGN
jgi:hypothetical protein